MNESIYIQRVNKRSGCIVVKLFQKEKTPYYMQMVSKVDLVKFQIYEEEEFAPPDIPLSNTQLSLFPYYIKYTQG